MSSNTPLFPNPKTEMSSEKDKRNLEGHSSSGESMNDATSESDLKDAQLDLKPPGPVHVDSMLSRRPTFSNVARNQHKKVSRHWNRFKKSNPARRATFPQPPENEDPASVQSDPKSILSFIETGGRCEPTSTDRSKTVKLPQFDDPCAYLPAEVEAKTLWEKEATRLILAVKPSDAIPPFYNQRFSGEGSEEEYRELGRLSEMILSALSLCLLDNECIYVEFCKPLANRDRLKKLIQQARVSQTNSVWEGGDAGAEAEAKVNDSVLTALFALVDYMSSVMARLLSQVAGGQYWSDSVLAVLTQRVTKLKVLLMDMHANTLISCQAGEAALDRTDISSRLSNGLLDEEECEEVLRIIDADTKAGLQTTANAEIARYCVEQNRIRSGIDTTIRYILLSLRFYNRSGLNATSFEICGMVYATGFDQFKVLLFQDRDLEYSASSNQDVLNTAYSAFKLLDESLRQVKHGAARKPPGRLQTTVEWRYEGHGSTKSDGHIVNDLACDLPKHRNIVYMDSMTDVITVMIPLVLTSPVAMASLTKYRTMMALECHVNDVVQPSKEMDYSAFFRMFTDKFDDDTKNWKVERLSSAVQKGFFSRYALLSPKDSTKNQEKVAQQMADISQDMADWVIDESSVTVACKFHVCSIFLVAFVIAGGGLSILAVGERIKGVDPSNLSMYLWILAGFYLLVCKSRFVENWPWSDFLRCRVRCRSVSELRAISGTNEQLIMAKLLHDERGGTLLKTRGPYNKAFLRRDSNDGFSIDSPPQMRTLLLSGLIMLKVVTPRGPALVCLDARRGTELKVVEHQGNQEQEHLLCEDIERVTYRGGKRKSNDHARLPLARSKELKWKRVQGVYKGRETEFV